MRASSFAFYILLITFIGLALGPYTIGQASDRLAEQGADGGEALRQGAALRPDSLRRERGALVFASRHIGRDEASRVERARAAGETGL